MSHRPTAARVRAMREKVGLTQWEAARVIYITTNAWQKYENGSRIMPRHSFELFKIKTGQEQPIIVKGKK